MTHDDTYWLCFQHLSTCLVPVWSLFIVSAARFATDVSSSNWDSGSFQEHHRMTQRCGGVFFHRDMSRCRDEMGEIELKSCFYGVINYSLSIVVYLCYSTRWIWGFAWSYRLSDHPSARTKNMFHQCFTPLTKQFELQISSMTQHVLHLLRMRLTSSHCQVQALSKRFRMFHACFQGSLKRFEISLID